MSNRFNKIFSEIFQFNNASKKIEDLSRNELEGFAKEWYHNNQQLKKKKNANWPFNRNSDHQKNERLSVFDFYNRISEIVFEVDDSGGITFINHKFISTLGYSPDEVIGRKITDFVSNNKFSTFPDWFDKKYWQLPHNVQFNHVDGSVYYLECRGNILDLNEEKEILVVFAIDITQGVAIEEEKAKERHLMLELVNNIPANLFVKNLRGEFVYANQNVANIVGANNPEQLIGKTDFDFYSYDLAKAFFDDEQKIIRTGEPLINKEELLHNDTKIIYFINSKVPIRDKDGKITGIIGIGKEITEIRNAAIILKESEQKYRFLFEKAPVGIFRSTSNGKLLDANPYMAGIFEYPSVEKMLDTCVNISTQFYNDPNRRNEFVNFLRKSGEVENFEFEALTNLGNRLWLSMNARISQKLEDDQFIIEGFLTDVTEKKTSEVRTLKQNEELKELNATKDKFFSIIAHDLRNPFNGLQALSLLLIKNYEEYDNAQVKEILDLINQSAERGVRLLENLLEWSRAQTGKIEYFPEYFSIGELVNESISLLSNQALKKKIKLSSMVPDDLQVFGDRNMIFTVIRNLISNAIKFTFKEGEVKILSEKTARGFTKLIVKDNGMGILPEYQNLLFKLGRNFSTKGTANETGTGLGLILCKDFVEKNGGTIWVESKYERGSSFIFTVPDHKMP